MLAAMFLGGTLAALLAISLKSIVNTPYNGAGTTKISLVPKLSLGTHLSGQLHCLCRVSQTKDNFADKRVPKCNLGTRR